MDEQLHERPERGLTVHRARRRPARATASLLALSVSPPTVAAIFLGGALGTVARYLLEAHHADRGRVAFPG